MFEAKVKVKKWGNSLGIVIPSEAVAKEHLKENQEINVFIVPSKPPKVKDIFGMLKGKKIDTEKVLREVDEELDSKFLRD